MLAVFFTLNSCKFRALFRFFYWIISRGNTFGFTYFLRFWMLPCKVSMKLLLFFLLFFFSMMLGCRNSTLALTSQLQIGPLLQVPPSLDFTICCPISPSLNHLPTLFLCHGIPHPTPNYAAIDFTTALPLLLSGDISVNPGPVVDNIRIGTVSSCCFRQKVLAGSDIIHCNSLDIMEITETWLTSRETTASLANITANDYSLHQCPRVGQSGDGVGLLVASALSFTSSPLPCRSSFEVICGMVSGKVSINKFNLYRPPGTEDDFF